MNIEQKERPKQEVAAITKQEQTAEIPIVLIEGDGIGKEITKAATQVLGHAVRAGEDNKRLIWKPAHIGKEAMLRCGEVLPATTLDLFREFGVGIKGPTDTPIAGGFRSVNVALRKLLELYANIRPVRSFEGLSNPVTTADDLNIVIFRENTEDIYAGLEYRAGSPEAKALADFINLEESGFDPSSALSIKPISEKASRRIVKSAVEFALEKNLNRITLVHKGNIMKYTEGAFRDWGYDEARKILGDRYLPWKEFNLSGKTIPDGKILVQDRIADAMFQDLILYPQNHQVLATMNLNGDYLSDAAAACVGGLGLAPGLNKGDSMMLAEAVHGTAPNIAGKGIANPTAIIQSGGMLLTSINLRNSANLIEEALNESFRRGDVTADLAKRHQSPNVHSTEAFADILCKRIDELQKSVRVD